MQRLSFVAITILVSALLFTGCKKQEKCAAGDSPEVCKAFQQCLKSNTSTEVCRMGEQDANAVQKSTSQH